mmetsp:Transcript_6055/g.20180  ORF Transcript_6055/g.20180 Transcript_6055/m.20180 type:complete len:279 (+) Transcript_6055:181-1017(+)
MRGGPPGVRRWPGRCLARRPAPAHGTEAVCVCPASQRHRVGSRGAGLGERVLREQGEDRVRCRCRRRRHRRRRGSVQLDLLRSVDKVRVVGARFDRARVVQRVHVEECLLWRSATLALVVVREELALAAARGEDGERALLALELVQFRLLLLARGEVARVGHFEEGLTEAALDDGLAHEREHQHEEADDGALRLRPDLHSTKVDVEGRRILSLHLLGRCRRREELTVAHADAHHPLGALVGSQERAARPAVLPHDERGDRPRPLQRQRREPDEGRHQA